MQTKKHLSEGPIYVSPSFEITRSASLRMVCASVVFGGNNAAGQEITTEGEYNY